jgi:parallel beta-helix repeat protein
MDMKLLKLAVLIICAALVSQLMFAGALASGQDGTFRAVSVKDFGAKGDGKTDDTKAIQAALDSSEKVYVPDGTYMINVDVSLQLHSNQTLAMSDGAVLKAIASAKDCHSLINIENASNVVVSGGSIVGERYRHLGSSGQRGMGIQIVYKSSNVTVKNVRISDFWGDGIYVGSPTGAADMAVRNITIENVVSHNNRRQGLSITDASNVTVKNSVFSNTNGTNPGVGIDIEPNEDQIAEDIEIINTQCTGNASSGIVISGYCETIREVSIINCVCSGNGSNGIYAYNASGIAVEGTELSHNRYGLQIERDVTGVLLKKLSVFENYCYGIALVGSYQSRGIEDIIVADSNIFNNYYVGAIVDNDDFTAAVKNITFENCCFADNRDIKSQKYGLLIGEGVRPDNIYVSNSCVFYGNTNCGIKKS